MEAAKIVKIYGGENDLLERIASDPIFMTSMEELEQLLSPEKYVGRAPEQTAEFLSDYVKPILDKYSDIDNNADEINV